MRAVHRICISVLSILLVAAMTNRINAQSDKEAVKSAVEGKRFVFHAQTALPSGGRSRTLTSDYDLRVSPDTLISNLPYYGRAYSVPYGSSDGGFNFTSTQFDYSATPGKKKGWNISIKPKDVNDFREFSFSISDNGYGSLQVLTNNRQPITFNGYISTK